MILRTLRNTDQPIRSYVWKAALIALIPSLVISAGVTLAMPGNGPSLNGPVVLVVFCGLVLGPWLETLLMWPVLWLLKRFITRPTKIAIASALFWGTLHSLSAPAWGLMIAWPFFVFSVAFLEWEKKSKGMAIMVVGFIHTCQNVIPAIAVMYGD